MNYALVQNSAWWQGLALSALRTGGKPAWEPALCQGLPPLLTPHLSKRPSIQAFCLSLGQLEPCQPPPYNEDFLAARSAHPGWAERGVNTTVRGWTHPTQARLSSGHVPAAASAERGRAGLWKGAGREGLRASLLVSDLSAAELGGAFQDQAVRPTVPAQMARPRPTGGRRYTAKNNNGNNSSSVYLKPISCQTLFPGLCMDYPTQSSHEEDTVKIQWGR